MGTAAAVRRGLGPVLDPIEARCCLADSPDAVQALTIRVHTAMRQVRTGSTGATAVEVRLAAVQEPIAATGVSAGASQGGRRALGAERARAVHVGLAPLSARAGRTLAATAVHAGFRRVLDRVLAGGCPTGGSGAHAALTVAAQLAGPRPSAQGSQEPPQSVAVSLPFFTWSPQVAAAQRLPTQEPVAQSDSWAQP